MAFLVTGNPTCPRLRVSGNPLVVRASCHFENTTSTRGPLRGLSLVLCNLSLCSSLCLVACILCLYWSSSLYFVFVLVLVLVLVLVPVLVLVQVYVLCLGLCARIFSWYHCARCMRGLGSNPSPFLF